MLSYESYKDSGVEWIGEIPKHWGMSKTNFLTTNLDAKRIPLNSEQRYNNKGDIPYWGSNGIIDYIDDYLFDEKLVLVGEDGSPFFERYKPVSFVSEGKTWINNHIHVLRTKPNVASEWLSASFNITDYKEYITGSTRDKLTQSDLNRIPHPLPPLEEQKLISRYLDKKTTQINSLIEKLQKKIELLKEQRTVRISQAVTRGLDPDVEMKDSGVEWIGKIPKHWKVSKLKYLSPNAVQYGLNIESDSYKPSGVRFLRITDINPDGSIKDGGVYLASADVPKEYYLNDGDILFSRSGATVGKSCLIENITEPMSFAGYLVRFSFKNKIQAKYIRRVVESGFYWDWIKLQSIQATIQNVNGKKYSNFLLPVPPPEEQNRIAHYLDKKTQQTDSLVGKLRKKIELLKEYRQALISSMVTGKTRVTEDMI